MTVEELRRQQQERLREAQRQMPPPESQSGEMMSPERPQAGGGNGGAAMMNYRELQTPQRIVAELSMAKMDRAIYSERQLYEQMVDFWFNHFNVFAGKGQDRWLLTSYERDAIRPHAMGKFRDLLGATAQSPAMLFYLDNWQSTDPEAAARLEQQRVNRQNRGAIGGSVSDASAGAAAGAAAAARSERKLRPRTDGAAHARRGRRLHAAGRDQRRARVHRLDHPHAAARSGVPVQCRACTIRKRRSSWARRSMPAACATANRCWTCSRAARRPRITCR